VENRPLIFSPLLRVMIARRRPSSSLGLNGDVVGLVEGLLAGAALLKRKSTSSSTGGLAGGLSAAVTMAQSKSANSTLLPIE
jgi:hypothetical protein